MTIFFLLISNAILPVKAASNGQQIMFVLTNDKFTYLRIEGLNQNDKWSVWENTYPNGATIAVTKDWWWEGTVNLYFNTEQASYECVLDYVGQGSNVVLVTYSVGQMGCTGDQGNAKDPLRKFVKSYTDALRWNDENLPAFEEINDANDAYTCLMALPKLAAGPSAIVKIPWACKGMVDGALEVIIKKTVQ